jgi:signal transduction histidine kinase
VRDLGLLGIAPDLGEEQAALEKCHCADALRSTNGAGLGLAVVRAIVDVHGGQIWLPGTRTGTRVRFSVPIAA